MSASLVGSEMCIRDRGRTPASHLSLSPAGLAEAARRAAGPPQTSTPPLPVSYTHLTLPTICSV
eukprot:9775971-Alexandrium_andersonii.AAC.1